MREVSSREKEGEKNAKAVLPTTDQRGNVQW
jgi:hypothetical protein